MKFVLSSQATKLHPVVSKMRHTDSASLAAVLLISLHLVYPTLAWRDTLPPVNTVTPQYQFLWTMRNGDDVFCDLVVHPGVDNRVLCEYE